LNNTSLRKSIGGRKFAKVEAVNDSSDARKETIQHDEDKTLSASAV